MHKASSQRCMPSLSFLNSVERRGNWRAPHKASLPLAIANERLSSSYGLPNRTQPFPHLLIVAACDCHNFLTRHLRFYRLSILFVSLFWVRRFPLSNRRSLSFGFCTLFNSQKRRTDRGLWSCHRNWDHSKRQLSRRSTASRVPSLIVTAEHPAILWRELWLSTVSRLTRLVSPITAGIGQLRTALTSVSSFLSMNLKSI